MRRCSASLTKAKGIINYISYICYDKLPQIWWLKTIGTYYLTVLWARSLAQLSPGKKIKVLTGLRSFLEALGRIRSLT